MFSLNAPTGAWCSLTLLSSESRASPSSLNAPTGAWCSLTMPGISFWQAVVLSQCTYRCVVLPDWVEEVVETTSVIVSMHLQVRGAP